MNKNVLIVNFNTQMLTEACIKSINKFSPGCRIFVLDNSDKEPFVNSFSNVTVFDNTHGEIVDFDKWLENYPKRKMSAGKRNNWGSAKHAYSVEKGMELINEPFLLLDSDVLLKKDVSSLFDNNFCYIGEIIEQDSRTKIKRVLPYICFINTTLCLSNGIHYFDETHMHGLYVIAKGDCYDTGAALFLTVKEKGLPYKEIKWNEYVEHYGSGSWFQQAVNMRKKEKIKPDKWLELNNVLWGEKNAESRESAKTVSIDDYIKPTEEVTKKFVIKKPKSMENEVKKPITIKTEIPKKKTTIEDGKKVVIKRPVHKQQTEHAALLSQVKKSTLTGRKIILIKKS